MRRGAGGADRAARKGATMSGRGQGVSVVKEGVILEDDAEGEDEAAPSPATQSISHAHFANPNPTPYSVNKP